MTHDKIRAAARRRMAQTGEPYATARREVIKDHQTAKAAGMSAAAGWFAIDYSDMGRASRSMDTLLGGGPQYGGVEVGTDMLRVRMADFHLDIPRSALRSVARSQQPTRGTIGVHARRGHWLVNGSHHGLVELTIEPPCTLSRQPSTLFLRMKVRSLTISLVDPDGFIDAIRSDTPHAE